VTVEQLHWARIGAATKGADEAAPGHKHTFWRDGAEKRLGRFVEVVDVLYSSKGTSPAQWRGVPGSTRASVTFLVWFTMQKKEKKNTRILPSPSLPLNTALPPFSARTIATILRSLTTVILFLLVLQSCRTLPQS